MILPTSKGWGRMVRVVCYALLPVAGVALAWQVGQGIPGIQEPLWWVMCGWLGLGGLFALLGQVFRRWTGEYVGLPLIGSALLGFSLLQLNLYGYSLDLVPSTALLWSFALLVFARWRDVHTLYRVAVGGKA